GNVNLVQLEPAGTEEVEREAATLGIDPVGFQVVGEREASTREGYLGIAVQYAGESDVIPFASRTADLEYRLASMIRSLTREERPVVALLQGHGELDPRDQMGLVAGRLREEYAVEEFRMDSTTTAVPDSFDAVVMAGYRSPLSPEEAALLGRYLDGGGKMMVLASGMSADPQSLFAGPSFNPGLDSLLSSRGIGIVPALAFDVRANEAVQVQSGLGRVVLPYPLWLYAQPGSGHVIVNGLSPLPFRYGSPLLVEEDSARVTTLLETTELGGRLEGPVSIDATQDWEAVIAPEDLQIETLAVAYADSAGGRMVVAGSPSFIADETLRGSQAGLAGVIFFQNAIDWLVEDEGLIAIRSKDRSPPQLLLAELPRDVVRYGNLVGVPLLFVLYGLFRGARRRRTRQREFEEGGALA
ncbi:MAG: GldG family protein, partial [Gemmatimonadota bacterium]|nr:GldG family protein [Gemmatimonadota bacterium]